MVILDHDDGVFVADLLEHGVGEALVGANVLLPIAGTEDGAFVSEVTEWPQSFVGENVVIPLFLFLGDPDAFECVAGIFGGNGDATCGVRGLAIGIARTMSDSEATSGTQNGIETSDQAAGGANQRRFAIAKLVHVWLTIADDDKGLATQGVDGMSAKPVARPCFVRTHNFLRFFTFLGASGSERCGEMHGFVSELSDRKAKRREFGCVSKPQAPHPVGKFVKRAFEKRPRQASGDEKEGHADSTRPEHGANDAASHAVFQIESVVKDSDRACKVTSNALISLTCLAGLAASAAA